MGWTPLPTLTRNNQKRWFRDMEIALKGKEVFFVAEHTCHDYSVNKGYCGIPPILPVDSDMQSYKEAQYRAAEHKAFGYLWQGDSLSWRDKEIYDQENIRYDQEEKWDDKKKNPKFKRFWEELKKKYDPVAMNEEEQRIHQEKLPMTWGDVKGEEVDEGPW